MAYGRFGVADNLCGISFAATDAAGKPAPIAAGTLAQAFGTSSGVVPTGGLAIINNNSVGGAVNTLISVSPSTGVQDYNVDAAVCYRNLWTGTDAIAQRVQTGVPRDAAVGQPARQAGDHRQRPRRHARSRSISTPGRTTGLNKIPRARRASSPTSRSSNAQHFDAFIDSPLFPGYDSAFVPLHYYFIKAMDAVYANLTLNVPLPPAQVVRTTPRGGTPGAAPPITTANVPPISAAPAAANQITFSGNTLTIPD